AGLIHCDERKLGQPEKVRKLFSVNEYVELSEKSAMSRIWCAIASLKSRHESDLVCDR
ncbi:MAG: hypothetical protein F6J96_36130, partial [Symploca sp. SIO1C2]|nr:hypothetical protein [Symploca sp. SIO1C2]